MIGGKYGAQNVKTGQLDNISSFLGVYLKLEEFALYLI